MQTYAWREQTPQPDREYRRLHARYLRQMREFKKALRRKYGCDGFMTVADTAEHSPFAGDWREEGGVK